MFYDSPCILFNSIVVSCLVLSLECFSFHFDVVSDNDNSVSFTEDLKSEIRCLFHQLALLLCLFFKKI